MWCRERPRLDSVKFTGLRSRKILRFFGVSEESQLNPEKASASKTSQIILTLIPFDFAFVLTCCCQVQERYEEVKRMRGKVYQPL